MCKVTLFLVSVSQILQPARTLTLESRPTETSNSRSSCQRKGCELLQYVRCFHMFNRYFKILVYKCTMKN
jgi:hypothetical protein